MGAEQSSATGPATTTATSPASGSGSALLSGSGSASSSSSLSAAQLQHQQMASLSASEAQTHTAAWLKKKGLSRANDTPVRLLTEAILGGDAIVVGQLVVDYRAQLQLSQPICVLPHTPAGPDASTLVSEVAAHTGTQTAVPASPTDLVSSLDPTTTPDAFIGSLPASRSSSGSSLTSSSAASIGGRLSVDAPATRVTPLFLAMVHSCPSVIEKLLRAGAPLDANTLCSAVAAAPIEVVLLLLDAAVPAQVLPLQADAASGEFFILHAAIARFRATLLRTAAAAATAAPGPLSPGRATTPGPSDSADAADPALVAAAAAAASVRLTAQRASDAAAETLLLVSTLVGAGTDVNDIHSSTSTTPLLALCDLLVARDLIAACGEPLLHGAVQEVARLLLDHSADATFVRAHSQDTALHVAASAGDRALCELLLSRGALIHALTKDGYTPADKALENGHSKLADLLRLWGPEKIRIAPRTLTLALDRTSYLSRLPPPLVHNLLLFFVLGYAPPAWHVKEWEELSKTRLAKKGPGDEGCVVQ